MEYVNADRLYLKPNRNTTAYLLFCLIHKHETIFSLSYVFLFVHMEPTTPDPIKGTVYNILRELTVF